MITPVSCTQCYMTLRPMVKRVYTSYHKEPSYFMYCVECGTPIPTHLIPLLTHMPVVEYA